MAKQPGKQFHPATSKSAIGGALRHAWKLVIGDNNKHRQKYINMVNDRSQPSNGKRVTRAQHRKTK